jgi:Tfp pilus assembly protein PilO
MNPRLIISHLGDLAWPKVLLYGLIAAVIYYFAGYNDGSGLAQELENSKAALTAAKRSLEQTKTAIANADKFEAEVKRLEQQFQRIRDYMPENLGPAKLTEVTTQQATQAGAVVTRLEPTSSGAEDKLEFYESSKTQFSLEGTYTQLVTFLSNLSKVALILTFEKVKLTQIGGELDHPKLSLTGVVVGYRYKTSLKPPEPGGKPGAGKAGAPASASDPNIGAPHAKP